MSMRFSKQEKKRLRHAFMATYNEKKPVCINSNLPRQVIKHIQELEIDDNRVAPIFLFEQFVWRIVPAALGMIIILMIFLMNTSVTPQCEMAQLVVSDPIAYDFLKVYGKIKGDTR